ncbi:MULTISPECIES: glycerophosphodiester phosphodiesterase [Gammaproteobacteria]|uniref:glycerophosphodiester phosphodiesterase n=1 Tax=Gammaproteobacteria TaxID=1236 RepID=UPI000DCFDC69|nr:MULTISPECIES: glycerophosphodiester phosphodiesterase [Gammaproteobacteria]RTE85704.1 glycerophosphodiester phosphodiesterase [Aliidiomarina sp. B3213]TCZ90296.1 glycerophosphodiester phosphodiesterase [Lysobacter sp. N42]
MLVIAHRGASALAPENTIAAFNKAIEAKADAIEFDVVQVGQEIYVFHDRYLERLTAQPGRFVDLTKEQINKLSIFGQHPIPTLAETLQCIGNHCGVNIEIKGTVDTSLLVDNIQHAIQNFNIDPAQLIVSSFNHHWLNSVKAKAPQIKIGALTSNCLVDYAKCAADLGAYSFHVDVNFICDELVKDAHARGLKVFVYTVDEPHDMHWLAELGVDGIFTNHPLFARNVLENRPTSGNEVFGRFQP